MAREIFILRHAKSDWDNDIRLDSKRPLAERGINDALRLGKWMDEHDLHPEQVCCSTAVRARQTLELVNHALKLPANSIRYDDDLYLAGLQTLLRTLADVEAQYRSVMLVGHNPGLDHLVSYISSSPVPFTNSGKLMATCTLAHFSCPDDWQELKRTGNLISIIRPADIPAE